MTNEPQFIYFVAGNETRDLLKVELSTFYPKLTPSFSKGDFLTYKNLGKPFSEKEVSQMQMCFALTWGISPKGVQNDFIENALQCQNLLVELPEESPSRAYLKIAEACKVFNISPNTEKNWIEFGSAPGGAIYYLLQNFGSIIGVDPGEMDSICKDNIMFTHIQKSIQNLSFEELPLDHVHYIASDLNLNPKQAIKEVLRLTAKYKDEVECIFMTIKMVKTEHVEIIPDYVKMFQKAGFKKVTKKQLPSHKREFLLFAAR